VFAVRLDRVFRKVHKKDRGTDTPSVAAELSGGAVANSWIVAVGWEENVRIRADAQAAAAGAAARVTCSNSANEAATKSQRVI
jgi:hypothetical protein